MIAVFRFCICRILSSIVCDIWKGYQRCIAVLHSFEFAHDKLLDMDRSLLPNTMHPVNSCSSFHREFGKSRAACNILRTLVLGGGIPPAVHLSRDRDQSVPSEYTQRKLTMYTWSAAVS